MARALGSMVMTGHKDKEYSMTIEFPDDTMPHQLRKGGYYFGQKTSVAMIEVLSKASGLQSTGASIGLEEYKPDVAAGDRATASTDELRNVESQCSTKSSKRATPGSNSPLTAMNSLEEVPEEDLPEEDLPEEELPEEDLPEDELPEEEIPSDEVPKQKVSDSFPPEAIFLQHGKPHWEKPLRSVGRAPNFHSHYSSEEEDDDEVTEIDDYTIFIGDQSNLVSLSVLPLKFAGRELIAGEGTVSTSEVSLLGKSGGLDVMRSITAWKLTFPETESFHISVRIMQTSAVERWVRLQKPRSGYKEIAEEIFSVAKFLAFLKMSPHASEGDFFSVTFCDHLRKQCSLIEQYIDLDLALKNTDARKVLLSHTQEKVSNVGKRVLLLKNGGSDEDDHPPVKKPKIDRTRPEVVRTSHHESEEEFAEDETTSDESEESDQEESDQVESGEDDESDDDQRGELFCVICDDGGSVVLCCDGPCLRSFHARPKDGIKTNCRTLGYVNQTNLEDLSEYWFCKNCEIKKHQCYICGALGDSDEALGSSRQVFPCDVASCGKFYHAWCVASKLKSTGGREALLNGIWAGKESFTCPLHRCQKCGKGEDNGKNNLHLATCRRCPSAWHLKCLPRTLSFHGTEKSHYEVRAWKISGRYFVYCRNHEILKDLGTPPQNHIQFPEATKENIHLKEKFPEATKTVEKFQKEGSIVGKERTGFRVEVSSPAVSQKLGRSSGKARPAPQHTSEAAPKRLVDDIVAKSKLRITEQSMGGKVFLPKIYRRKEFEWMGNGRIDSILNGAKAAMEKFNKGFDSEDAKLKCAPDQVSAITNEEERLRGFLAPALFGNRYTSFGRQFTRSEKLEKVVEALGPHIRDEDTIVDFSCGDNSFSRLLHDTLAKAGKTNCQYKNFDIFTAKDDFGFERKDWFNVRHDDCGPGDKLVIGLNPPPAHAEMFVSHALRMEPRVLVLIVPPLNKRLLQYGYECYLDDRTTLANKSFYLPGSVQKSDDEWWEQGNGEPPHLYIYGRKTSSETPNAEPSAAYPSQQTLQNRKITKPGKQMKLKPPSNSLDHLFIPSRRLRDSRPGSARPQHMPSRTPGATGPRLQREESEILPLPPPGPPPPFQPRVPDYPPEIPLHYSHDEYNPSEPGFYPRVGPQSLPPVNFPSLTHPDVPLENAGPSWHQNQQLRHGPVGALPLHFQPDHDTESGGRLDDEVR